MADSISDRILGELSQIAVDGLDGDLVSLGLVSEITETEGKVISLSRFRMSFGAISTQFARMRKSASRQWTALNPHWSY